MEAVLAIKCKDFVMICTDMSMKNAFIILREDQRKISTIGNNLLMATVGLGGDPMQFTDFITKNINLYNIHNDYTLKPTSVAHYMRQRMADFLRARQPYQVNTILGGYDAKVGSTLVFIDFLGNMRDIPYGGHGCASALTSSIIQRFYHDNLTPKEALNIIKACLFVLQNRFIFNFKNFHVAIVDKLGARDLAILTADQLTKLPQLGAVPKPVEPIKKNAKLIRQHLEAPAAKRRRT